jgi:hypothetical protein
MTSADITARTIPTATMLKPKVLFSADATELAWLGAADAEGSKSGKNCEEYGQPLYTKAFL